MATAREIMHRGVECIGAQDTLADAARRMRDLDVGSLPICGTDDRLQGIITDRDIVVKCIAEGHDPNAMMASDLAQGTVFWIDIDADEDDVLQMMETRHVRRLPVLEEHELVGIISEVDVARCLPEDKIGRFVEHVYDAR
jgi:CBS domain-containing protein